MLQIINIEWVTEYKIFVLVGKETETITIKQENGLLLQYELPVEHDPQGQWTRTLVKTPSSAVVTKAPGPRKRGRPRKYPNEQGQIGKDYVTLWYLISNMYIQSGPITAQLIPVQVYENVTNNLTNIIPTRLKFFSIVLISQIK